ncbi:MAG: hypothetical protein ABI662_09365 [Dermatophilaceae bacterium]
MSVETQLGLDGTDTGLLAVAHQSWGRWVAEQAELGVVSQLADLPAWLTAHPGERNTVLGALSGLAAQDEGDDVAAAGALAWLLVPGASLLASRLATLSPIIDQLVAAQLWIEVRTFGHGRGRRVAATILGNTRKRVLRDLGVRAHTELAWQRCLLIDPVDLERDSAEPVVAPAEREPGELSDLLERARAQQVISDEDLTLLLLLAQAADDAGQTHWGRACYGLMTPVASSQVAQRWGVSARTVRRRARRSLDALSRYALTERSA